MEVHRFYLNIIFGLLCMTILSHQVEIVKIIRSPSYHVLRENDHYEMIDNSNSKYQRKYHEYEN